MVVEKVVLMVAVMDLKWASLMEKPMVVQKAAQKVAQQVAYQVALLVVMMALKRVGMMVALKVVGSVKYQDDRLENQMESWLESIKVEKRAFLMGVQLVDSMVE